MKLLLKYYCMAIVCLMLSNAHVLGKKCQKARELCAIWTKKCCDRMKCIEKRCCAENGKKCKRDGDCCSRKCKNKICVCQDYGKECVNNLYCCSWKCNSLKKCACPSGYAFKKLDNQSIKEAAKEWKKDQEAATQKYGLIEYWNVKKVTNMDKLFRGNRKFNQNLECWDVSAVTSMMQMFSGAKSFDQNFYRWDVSKVKSMRKMFYGAKKFNGVFDFDVSSVTDMSEMFSQASMFVHETNKTLIFYL